MAKKQTFEFDLNVFDGAMDLVPNEYREECPVQFMSIIKNEDDDDRHSWYKDYNGPLYTTISFCCTFNYYEVRNSDWIDAAILMPEHKGPKIFKPGRCTLRLREDTLALIEPVYDVEKGKLTINVKYV